jgi:hypothetical protein
MVRKTLITLVSLSIVIAYAITLNAQVIKIPKPKLPKKPPTAEDIKREAVNARKEAQSAWDKVKNLNPAGASEEAWGEAGRHAYPAAAKVMSKRSPTGVGLDKDMKAKLRGQYGELVNKVTIHWGTPGLDEWTAAKYGIRLTKGDSEAQTYGHDIYIKWRKGQKPDSYILNMLRHEMMHARQYERFDKSLSNFGYHYFKEYKKANQNYEKNKLEREAFAAERIASTKPSSPPSGQRFVVDSAR